MASAQQLIQMIRSHATGDDDRFLSIAEEIAEDAAKAGRGRMAADLNAIVNHLRTTRQVSPDRTKPVPLAAPRGELAALMQAVYPERRLSDLVVDEELDQRLRRVVRENREREKLAQSNLTPRRKLLFSGPPGTGKSLTAAAIAGELGLPLFTIKLDGVITKFMGETAAKLRLIFDSMQKARGVYFFDEVDALATRRGREHDIGEARRMLTSLLMLLEDDESTSIIVAATNHRMLLDPAIFRRFHGVFTYELPSPEKARQVLRNHLLLFDRDALEWHAVDEAARNLSHADLTAAADDAARDAVLDHEGKMDTKLLIRALKERSAQHRD